MDWDECAAPVSTTSRTLFHVGPSETVDVGWTVESGISRRCRFVGHSVGGIGEDRYA